ncbi:hypothetical protein GGR58DRAFT_249598 [Xylaria digitata]|nr:hypothetical protein GGR58DRAFT_249598 [Xylaria digitata]
MSHLAPQAAIFSPSVARAAALTAKDWAYVDAWLRRQYAHLGHEADSDSTHRSKPPSFERNPETLEALLALIATNEEADEERLRLAQLESAALDEVRAAEAEKESRRSSAGTIHGDLLAEDLLQALDAELSKDGLAALDALADVSLTLNTATDASSLAHRFVTLQGSAHETSQLLHRVHLLQSYLDDESARLHALLEELRQGRQYEVPADSNAELQRATKSADARLPALRRQVEALESKVGVPDLTVEEVRLDEEVYLDLLAKKKNLDAQVRAFAGLSPDVEAARAELEGLRARLREATGRRDANFEMLVERESPVKVRTSRRY